MKIFAYKCNHTDDRAIPLEEILAAKHAVPLAERKTKIGSTWMRIEHFEVRDGLHYANFVNIRDTSGPGILSDRASIEGIEMEADEFFGEETAMIYDPSNRYALIQYNHHGPKAPGIKQYLRVEADGVVSAYEFFPKLTPTSEADLLALSVVSRIEISFAIPDLNGNENVGGSSVNSVIDLARRNGAGQMSLVLANRGGMITQVAKETITGIWNLFTGDSAMTKLQIRGQYGDENPRETIDLISDRLSQEVNLAPGPDRRLPLESRWTALLNTLNFWRQSNDLT